MCPTKSLQFFIEVEIMIIIIKELANESEGQFECIGENKEKKKTLSVPIKKEIRKADKESNETVETVSYKITFIDSARFMTSSL